MTGNRFHKHQYGPNPHDGSRSEETWTYQAACRDIENPNIFTEDPNKIIDEERKLTAEVLAKEVCRRCVVRVACLNHALVTDERVGIWGGMTPQERRQPRLDHNL